MARLESGALATSGPKLVLREPGIVAAWAAIYLAIGAAVVGLVVAVAGPAVVQLVRLQSQPDPASFARVMGPLVGVYALAMPAALILQTVFIAAIYRAVLRPQDRRFLYLRLGGDELRLVLVSILLVLIAMVLTVILAGVAAASVAAVPTTVGKVLAGIVLGFAVLAALAYVGVRLCLATPITFAQRRISLLASWSLTRGHFWTLLSAFLLTLLLLFAVSVVGQVVMGAVLSLSGGALLDLFDKGALNVAALPALAPVAIAYGVVVVAMSVAQTVFSAAPLASAYRDLVDDPELTSETFA